MKSVEITVETEEIQLETRAESLSIAGNRKDAVERQRVPEVSTIRKR
jgi:hypothetical protein